jgi:membrane-bound metal-dependent hydrolase YbcI (DUF457 family)
MASYRGHIAVASVLGGVYGAAGSLWLGMDWGPVFLGAGLTAVGGLMPDLDSDSGVPVRELFSLAAVMVPLLLIRRLHHAGLTPEQILALMACVYVLVRYGGAALFKRITVHRGMFHSLPAMVIAGLVIYLGDHRAEPRVRFFLAGGVMLGFLSHLVLDEVYSVDFSGRRLLRLNKYAGTAVKLYSPSWIATLTCYTLLASLAWVAWREVEK